MTDEVSRPPVQMLWIGQRLSSLERLSIASFLAHGHRVHLYVYEAPENVPPGVVLKDATRLLTVDRIFTYGPRAKQDAGSIAAFANVFRYKLLLDRGGWWSDTDVVCLRPFDFQQPYVFGRQDAELINNAVIRAPAGSDVMTDLYESATGLGRDIAWGEAGPNLLTRKVEAHGLQEYVLPPSTFYPVPFEAALGLFGADPSDALRASIEEAHGVHLWNEVVRRGGLDKDGDFPSSSIYESLRRRYAAQLAVTSLDARDGLQRGLEGITSLVHELSRAQAGRYEAESALEAAQREVEDFKARLLVAERSLWQPWLIPARWLVRTLRSRLHR